MIIRSRLLVYLFAVIIALDSTNAGVFTEVMRKMSQYLPKRSPTIASSVDVPNSDQVLSLPIKSNSYQTQTQPVSQYEKYKGSVLKLSGTSKSDLKFAEANHPLSEVLTKTSKPLLSKHDLETRMELFQKDGSLSIMKIGPGKDGRTLKSQTIIKKGDKGYEKALKKFNDQSSLARKGDSIYKPSLLNEHETFTFEALDGKTSAVKFSHTNPNQVEHSKPRIDEDSPRGRQLKKLNAENLRYQQNEQNEQKNENEQYQKYQKYESQKNQNQQNQQNDQNQKTEQNQKNMPVRKKVNFGGAEILEFDKKESPAETGLRAKGDAVK